MADGDTVRTSRGKSLPGPLAYDDISCFFTPYFFQFFSHSLPLIEYSWPVHSSLDGGYTGILYSITTIRLLQEEEKTESYMVPIGCIVSSSCKTRGQLEPMLRRARGTGAWPMKAIEWGNRRNGQLFFLRSDILSGCGPS